MELSEVMQLARLSSTSKGYNPERSQDLPFFQALIQKLREESGEDGGNGVAGTAATAGSTYTLDRTISGLSTGTYADLFTVGSTNSACAFFMYSSFIEVAKGAGVDLIVYLQWTFNGTPTTSTLSISAAGGAGYKSTHDGPVMLDADIGTAVQWKYDVTAWTSGTHSARFIFYLQQIA